MKNVRRAVAMTLVATALCADRAVAASPDVRPAIAREARTFVGRLTVSFRRSVPAVRIYQTRLDKVRPVARRPVVGPSPAVVPPPISPFQFRLPPPVA